jgi:hypothetical protein
MGVGSSEYLYSAVNTTAVELVGNNGTGGGGDGGNVSSANSGGVVVFNDCDRLKM